MNYYNEFDPFAATWLEELIKDGVIPAGKVDSRSIIEVTKNDLSGFRQCHFFAGIGGWSLALKLAGWPEDKEVWTGSCPCQPYSTAGKQKGKADERHLWPVWFKLIKECRPTTLFGEQVAAAITHGWLDSIYDDLEGEGYAVGSAVLPACSVGKAHKRDRLWFVAKSNSSDANTVPSIISREEEEKLLSKWDYNAELSSTSNVGDTEYDGLYETKKSGSYGKIDDRCEERSFGSEQFKGTSDSVNVADTFQSGLEGVTRYDSTEKGWEEQIRHYTESDTFEWVECPDGKIRSVKSGIRLLANGFPNRVGILRGFGNAIVPQVAAEFIKATM